MRVVETKVYQFEELSDKAKEKARDWFKETDIFSDTVSYDDFIQVANILGISFDAEQHGRSNPAIYWNLHGQGQFCAFNGRYDYNENAPSLMREYAPVDSKLIELADTLAALQKTNDNLVSARMKCDRDYLTVETYLDGDSAPVEIADEVKEAMRGFAKWIFESLTAEWEYTQTNEYVDDNIIANEYEFTEDGKRFVVK